MSKRILVIESDEPFAHELQRVLSAQGFTVQVAVNSEQGMTFARTDAPDLIVVCVEALPTNGYMLCTRLKKDEQLKQIPIILTSADATPDSFEKHKRLKTRAEEYLIKPFAPKVVGELAARLLKHPGAVAPAPHEQDRRGSIVDDEPLGLGEPVDGDEPLHLTGSQAAEAHAGLPDQHGSFDDVEVVDELGGEVLEPEEEQTSAEDDLRAFDDAFDALAPKPRAQPPTPPADAEAAHAEGSRADDAHLEAEHLDALLFSDLPQGGQATSGPLPEALRSEPHEGYDTAGENAAEHALDEAAPREHDTAPLAAPPDHESAEDEFAVHETGPVATEQGDRHAELDARIAELEAQLAACQVEVAAARKDAGAAAELLRTRAAKSQAEQEILRLKEELARKEKELLELRAQAASELELHRTKAVELGRELAVVRTQHEAALAGARKEHESALDNARAHLNDAQAQHVSALNGARAQHESELGSVRAQHEAELGEERAKHESELTGAQALHESELEQLREELSTQEQDVEKLEQQLAALREESARNEERAVRAYQRIKGDERLREKTRKALQIALALLDEPPAAAEESPAPPIAAQPLG